MSTKSSKKTSTTSEYTSFLKSLRLTAIALEESKLRVKREALLKTPESFLTALWEGEPLTRDKDFFEVSAHVKLEMHNPKKETVLQIEAKYLIHFHCAGGKPNPEHLRRFSDAEARFIVWPYFREYVSSMCGRMQIPPVFLPLMD